MTTSHAGHKITKCVCGRVLTQCRCAAPNKPVETRKPCRCPGVVTKPSVEERDRFVSDLMDLDGGLDRRLYITAAIKARDDAVLEAAAEVAELFVPTGLSTQTHGERIGERIRKLKADA